MILTLYLSLVLLAIVIIGVGVVLGENYFSVVGLFFLFLLGSSLMFNGVDYETGKLTLTSYNYLNNTLLNETSTLTYAYSTLDDSLSHWFGFLMAVASGGGMAAIMSQANRDFKAAKDYERDFSE